MAYLDYGAVVKKNGKILNEENEFFQDIKKIVGMDIKEIDGKDIGSYFNYIGNEEYLICIYRLSIHIYSLKENKLVYECFGLYDENHRDIFRRKITLKGENKDYLIDIKRINSDDRFKLRVWLGDDLWECLYGYGVALNKNYWYDKTRKLNLFLDKWFNENI